MVTHDDLYAHTWDTNFGTDPFEIELPDNEQDDIQESVPINHPPSLEISKNSRGAPYNKLPFLKKKPYPKIQKMKSI